MSQPIQVPISTTYSFQIAPQSGIPDFPYLEMGATFNTSNQLILTVGGSNILAFPEPLRIGDPITGKITMVGGDYMSFEIDFTGTYTSDTSVVDVTGNLNNVSFAGQMIVFFTNGRVGIASAQYMMTFEGIPILPPLCASIQWQGPLDINVTINGVEGAIPGQAISPISDNDNFQWRLNPSNIVEQLMFSLPTNFMPPKSGWTGNLEGTITLNDNENAFASTLTLLDTKVDVKGFITGHLTSDSTFFNFPRPNAVVAGNFFAATTGVQLAIKTPLVAISRDAPMPLISSNVTGNANLTFIPLSRLTCAS